jgi:hypothetical protein
MLQTLEEISISPNLKFVREKHNKNDFTNLVCDICDQTNPLDPDNLIYCSNNTRKVGDYAYEVKK